MVGTTAQIERDIAALEKSVSELADAFHSAYATYLAALGKALRQQLILAAYHICTQGHPDRFIKLSYSQRQHLQKNLKSLASQVQEELLACLLQPGVEILPDLEADDLQTLDEDLDDEQDDDEQDDDDQDDDEQDDDEQDDDQDDRSSQNFGSSVLFRPANARSLGAMFFVPPPGTFLANLDATSAGPPDRKSTNSDSTNSEAPPTAAANSEAPAAPKTLTPLMLLQWQRDLEQAIAEELRTASHAANRILQQASILSPALPEAILDIAAQAEGADTGSVPNVLNLLIGENMGDRANEGRFPRPGGDRASGDRAEENRFGDERSGSERFDEERSAGERSGSDRSSGDRVGDDRPHLKLDLSALSKAKPPAVIQLLAIHLRLTEIEFADAGLTLARSKVRHLAAQLKPLGRNYHKKLRERAIAEAQAAWRSCWSED